MVGKLLILKFIIMKKKIIIASASVLFAVATMFNMNLLQANSAGDVSLDAISVMSQAEAESFGCNCDFTYPGLCYCYGFRPYVERW